MEFRKQGHCLYHTQYHLVLTTKYRRKIFNEGIMEYLRDILKRVSEHYPEVTIEKANADQDHVHLLMTIPPKIAVSQAVRIIKSNTAKALRDKFPHLATVYWGVAGIWSEGYFVSTVGINEDIIRKYIEHQGKEDSGQAKLVI